jgi:very-short-patch-repair endonuclease
MYRDKNQRDFARSLRNNSTDAERKLWNVLRAEKLKGYKFRRQAAIGDYVVDFVCFSHKLVVELDGGQHNEAEHKQYDEKRSNWLYSRGFHVLRFWNHDVFENIDGIADVILCALEDARRTLAPPPSPALPAEGRE